MFINGSETDRISLWEIAAIPKILLIFISLQYIIIPVPKNFWERYNTASISPFLVQEGLYGNKLYKLFGIKKS